MTGTYLSKTDGDTYRVWWIDELGARVLIAEGLGGAHEIAQVEVDHQRTTEQQETDR